MFTFHFAPIITNNPIKIRKGLYKNQKHKPIAKTAIRAAILVAICRSNLKDNALSTFLHP
jgi:hypothetical protein